MSIVKKYLFNSFLFLLAFSPLAGKEDHRVEFQQIAFEEAIALPNKGTLSQKENGFVYLDVPNEFVSAVVPLLDHPGLLRARPTAAKSMGAHISVFHEQENVVPVELGTEFSFQIGEIRSFTLHTRDGLKKLWVITVVSPELEALREQYGCSSRLKGYEFHITLGKQMPSAPEGWESRENLSGFNYSDEPTVGLSSKGDFIVVDDNDILNTAAKVDAVGQLCLKGNGFVYVDVDDQYVDNISQQLPIQGRFSALSTGPKKMGAHISVIYEDEMIGKEIWNLAEAGEWFTFEVKELRYVDRGGSRLWLLAAEAPALERLRTHYGLKPKLQGHDFHITLGKEQLIVPLSIEAEADVEMEEVFQTNLQASAA